MHSLGTGTDTRKGWAVWIVVACVALVLLAVAWRIVAGLAAAGAAARPARCVVTACAVAVVFTWAKQGPFAPGWSKRAGTPPAVGSK